MFCQKSQKKRCLTSFEGVPSLVNEQYQYKTLGEMVAMYKRTGEFPAVGMRNGVYFAKDIEDTIPMPPADKFEAADRLRGAVDAIEKTEKELQDAKDKEAKEKADKDAADLAAFRAAAAASDSSGE